MSRKSKQSKSKLQQLSAKLKGLGSKKLAAAALGLALLGGGGFAAKKSKDSAVDAARVDVCQKMANGFLGNAGPVCNIRDGKLYMDVNLLGISVNVDEGKVERLK
jgi:hypothetical protein